MAEKVSIRFFLNGTDYASRYWACVPRVGDEVMLYNKAAGEKIPFMVERVVWGVEAESGSESRVQCVNIKLANAPDREA